MSREPPAAIATAAATSLSRKTEGRQIAGVLVEKAGDHWIEGKRKERLEEIEKWTSDSLSIFLLFFFLLLGTSSYYKETSKPAIGLFIDVVR